MGNIIKAWWLDRLYKSWYGEDAVQNAEGWRLFVYDPGIRQVTFMVIGLAIGLIVRGKEESILINLIAALVGAFAGGIGTGLLLGHLGKALYGPYASLVGAIVGSFAVVMIKRSMTSW